MTGKTNISYRFLKNQYDSNWIPTVENNFSKKFRSKGQDIEMIIKDSQGLNNDIENFRNEYGYGYHGYILVYSIDDRRSLEVLKLINSKVLSLTHQKVPRVLVANKVDLANVNPNLRQVSITEGQALADKWGCSFVECSAKENLNIEEIFHAMVDEIDIASEPEYSARPCPRCFDWRCCPDESLLADSATLELALKYLTHVTLFLGLAIIVLSIGIGVGITDHDGLHESSLLSYVLFALGFLICTISILGLIGVKQANEDFLRVYSVSLTIIVITEIIVWSILCHQLQLMADYIWLSVVIFFISIALKVLSIGVVCCYQKAQPLIDSPYPTYSTFTNYDWVNVNTRS